MRYEVQWPAEVILPPADARHDWCPGEPWAEELPADGFPRITSEGVEILKEGLRGDFSRWEWGIGNHPMEMPSKYLRNLHIRAMDDRPHFYATFWYGPHFPSTKKNLVMTPWFCFDRLDDLVLEHADYKASHICLEQTADFWAHLPLLLDDNEQCAT